MKAYGSIKLSKLAGLQQTSVCGDTKALKHFLKLNVYFLSCF